MPSRRYHSLLVLVLLSIVIATGCTESIWDELPKPISSFVVQYFPGVSIDSYSVSDDNHYVKIQNGASLVFDCNYDWTTVDGNGSAIPSDLVFDQFPKDLYNYLDAQDMTEEVYAVTRTGHTYTVTLENTVITYDTDTHTVVYP